MTAIQKAAALALAATLSGCGGTESGETSAQMDVRGATLTYRDNRAAGPAIVFLHGAVTDLRMWDSHRAQIGDSFRTVAYTQRYHGTEPWSANWPAYGVNTHSQDLTAFIEKLQAGPVHVVAWSYAGHVALAAALGRPELFRSVFIYEPGVPSYVTDPAAREAQRTDAMTAFGPVFGAVQKGDDIAALKLMLDASGQSPGYFDRQPAPAKEIQLDNARTMSELMLRQEAAPAIDCQMLAAQKVPIRVGYGANSRPLYSVVGQAAQNCIGGSGHLVVAGHNHMWPQEDPAAFTKAVLDFVKGR